MPGSVQQRWVMWCRGYSAGRAVGQGDAKALQPRRLRQRTQTRPANRGAGPPHSTGAAKLSREQRRSTAAAAARGGALARAAGPFPGRRGRGGAAIMAAAVARRGRLGREGRASLCSFLLGASVAALPLLLGSSPSLLAAPGLRGRLALVLHVAGVNAALLLIYPRPLYKVRGWPG